MSVKKWKYTKPLGSLELVEAFEKEKRFEFPLAFKEKILKINGGRPESQCFVTVNGNERAIKSFLSFNRNDRENVWEPGEWMSESFRKYLVPFAIDNFGNYICFDQIGTVIFACHDPLCYEVVAYGFDEFLNNLY